MPMDFNQQIIDEFRANNGRVGGPFEGGRLLLLTTTGARSGKPHTVPVVYLPDGAEKVLIIASAAGAPKHPAWFHNLVADPKVTVENGLSTYQAEATVLTGDERDRMFARAAEADAGWAAYQAKTSRIIPVVALKAVEYEPWKTRSFGAVLKMIHDAFRRELALIRKEVVDSGPGLGAQLRVNCLTVCQGLHMHHTHEDTGLFPAMREQRPGMAPAIDRLATEHERVAELIAELQRVIADGQAEPPVVLAEVDRLTEELEAHLTYEEEQLIPVLDAT